jgi:lipopolysaccharide transport system ATP-binding protein
MSSPDSRIVFDRVWKKFHRGALHDSLRDLIPAVAKRMVGRGPKETELAQDDFWAVRDLSFEVLPGQTLGIIGPNGSGKSTTLRMLTKILEPTRGRAEVRGRVGALIEVSAGFHGDLTGRENVFLQGAIMGMRTAQIERKFDEIVEFSGIPEFIDTPVKRYSSGMNARLGFSIAAHLEPDVLIIDEVLAVGDMSFQERAFGRIREMANSGLPVCIVSHQLDRVAELCSEAILLRKGQLVYRGTPTETIGAYVQALDTPRFEHEGEQEVEFSALRALDDRPVRSGHRWSCRVDGRIFGRLRDSLEPLQIRVRSLQSGRTLFLANSRRLGLELTGPGAFSVRLDLQANLPAGDYLVEVVAHDAISQRAVAMAPGTTMHVYDPSAFAGTVQLNPEVSTITG